MVKNVVKSLKFCGTTTKAFRASILLLPRSQCIRTSFNLFENVLFSVSDVFLRFLATCRMSFKSHKHMSDCKRHKNHKKLIKNAEREKNTHIKFMSFENIMHVQIFFVHHFAVAHRAVKSFSSMLRRCY